jgi:hypothetical protein
VVFSIEVPSELHADHRAAIESHVARLNAAQQRGDLSDVVGCAKELTESIARVVLDVRGKVLSDSTSYGSLITEGHRAVERQPGEGLASDDATVRKIAQSAKNLIADLGQLRNAFGTGHGRAHVPAVLEEHARIAAHAVAVWACWMLARLPSYLLSDVHQLIELLTGGVFYRGDLARRLNAIELRGLEDSEARALGVAVGRRTTGETFNVRREGVDSAISQPERFPDAYRRGVIEGLLMNSDGALSTTPASVVLAVDLVLVDDNPGRRLDEIEPLIATSTWNSPATVPPTSRDTVTAAAVAETYRLPDELRVRWRQIWTHPG